MKELLEKILGQIKKTPSGVRAYEDLYHICLETQKTDIPLSVEYLKKLSDIIENRIPQSETDKELRSLFMLHKKVLLAAAPFDFESYLLYVEWEREPDKKFYVPRREVMHPVVQAMQDLIDDRLDLLTISMPPGTGKSTLGIFFLSWVMGRFPDSQSLASAHSGMLTRSFYDGVYQIITDSEYLWADVFPGVKMAATNSKEETIDLHKKHRFSTLTCRAINASLTGATRCDKILYADDLCSGIEEAMSKERLDKLWSAYTNDLKSRKKEGAKEMLKLVLRICRDLGGLTLKLSDIDMKFTRRNYEAIQSKSQVLISMLQEPKIHPQLAFQHSGMFSDAESAYNMSMKYYEEQQEKAAELAKKTTPDDSGDDDNDPDNNDI